MKRTFCSHVLLSPRRKILCAPPFVTRRAAVFALFAFGAASLPFSAQAAGPVWPPPPDEPKIEYVGAVKSVVDVGGKPVTADALRKPYGVAVDAAGRMYVTDEGRVLVFDTAKHAQGYLGDTQGPGKLKEPTGIAVSKDGRIFVTDIAAKKVLVYSAEKTLLGAIGGPGEFDTPSGVAVDERGKKIYVVDSKKHRVAIYALDGYAPLGVIGSRGIGKDGRFNFPTNAAVDSQGNLYVVDTGNYRVQVFDKSGKHLRNIGKPGILPGSFARPKGIAVDSEDHIYVADAALQNIQIFNPEGRLLLFFGTGGWGPGYFTLPAGMVIDSRDRVYVVDQWPGNVQIFKYLGRQGLQAQEGASEGNRNLQAGVAR